jgi:hypothetical protein
MKSKNIGRFTLSLDCEGLWGMADQSKVLNSSLINRQSLDFAYDLIVATLNKEEIKSTCAFVTAFSLDAETLCDSLSYFNEISKYKPEWFNEILPRLRGGGDALDGFIGGSYWRSMMQEGHEMAWHGTTHMPLDDQTCIEAVELELQFAKQLFHKLAHTPTSVVFPRNLVGHLDLLHSFGFTTYRASKNQNLSSKILNLLSEYHVYDGRIYDEPIFKDGWNVSPAGFFLNWPYGVRALIPAAVTIKRWKSLLRKAAEKGGYVHMWFHPHNLITAPSMQVIFIEIMREVGALIRQGDLQSVTMAEARYLHDFKG